ncbi:unnamed protein product [Microthlaspi erraticum]|uniref:F-box domain-containing protein n=1 Tax=Microthlaspi erraticum TaxID=1685480 RepID=A0A6D2KE65_9BRAS|nr:unnamed protein product [Microthlaspi erraticum]
MENLEQKFQENLSVTSRIVTQSPSSVRKYSDPIPVDLLIEIFSRLPRKSIDRFRCVSKLWRYILRRPDFTSIRPEILFTVKVDGKILFCSSPQPQNQDDNCTLVATPFHTSFPEYFPSNNCSTVCGLALLHRYDKRKGMVVCNPRTGAFQTLPKLLMRDKSTLLNEEIARISLGYDPISKQFKVLCVTSSPCDRPDTHQVLTLESGKPLWRRIECEFHFKKTYRMRGEICINGVLYFGAWLGETYVVVCFDVRTERFGFINLDKDMLGDDDGYVWGELALFNYKGKLGLREGTPYLSREDELVLWMLEDAPNHKWSKHSYQLPRFLRYKWFVGMTSTGDIVFLSFPDHRSKLYFVYFFNPERKTFATVNIQGFEEFKTWHTIRIFLDYMENLKFM